MIIGVLTEHRPSERRVALIPQALAALGKQKHTVLVESGAGIAAGHPDAAYATRGAQVLATRAEVIAAADVLLMVNGIGSWGELAETELEGLRPGQVLIGMFDPLSQPAAMQVLAERGVQVHAMELIPRISRAQAMDVLSSMATIAGYKAVLLAANAAPRLFPLLMTAGGTVTPAHVLVIGIGVAGLQAIATAKRLGAVVHAYDVRPAAREQAASLGAKPLDLGLDSGAAEDAGGYARAQGEDFLRQQRDLLGRAAAEMHAIVTTAAVPGKAAPLLLDRTAVERMAPDTVIIDLAAERGGNCELTVAGEWTEHHGVRICGPVNLPAELPAHASQLYSQNLVNFLTLRGKTALDAPDMDDPIIAETLVTRGGAVVHARVRELAEAADSPQMMMGAAS